MKKPLSIFLGVFILIIANTNIINGSVKSCCASVCLGDIRVGYYMNQGYELRDVDYLESIPLSCCTFSVSRLYAAYQTGYKSNGCMGGIISFFLGNKAGEELDKYTFRPLEKIIMRVIGLGLLTGVCFANLNPTCVSCIGLVTFGMTTFPVLYILFQEFNNVTWDEVVQKEKIARSSGVNSKQQTLPASSSSEDNTMPQMMNPKYK